MIMSEDTVKIEMACTPHSHLCHVGETVEFFITADREIPLEADLIPHLPLLLSVS